ncbi:MAG: DUF1592 domain-containing protein [Pirellulales bacterium]
MSKSVTLGGIDVLTNMAKLILRTGINKCMRVTFFAITTAISLVASTAWSDDAAEFDKTVQPLFAKYCLRCHDSKKQEGQFRLDNVSRNFADMLVAQRWSEVMFRVNSGEMPPKDQPQLSADELSRLVEVVSRRIDAGRAARMASRGPVSHYRLSRDEYSRTLYDLLGVHFDPTMPGALNEDPRWHGFDRIGSLLTLSPSHVERYLKAADSVLRQAYPEKQPPSATRRQATEAPNRWLIYPSLLVGNIQAPSPGLYRIRVQLSGLPSFQGRLPRLSLWNNSLKRAEVGQDVLAAEDQPTVIEIETFLPQGGFQLINEAPGKLDDGPTPSLTPKTVTRLKDYRPSPIGYKLLLEDGRPIFPLLLVDWYECEGPIVSPTDSQKRAAFFPEDLNESAGKTQESPSAILTSSRATLAHFISRAWRRPATEAEVERYLQLMSSELAAGESPRAAYLSAMTAVLSSQNFYYLVEGTPTAPRDRINDFELASRLSYFLWSSLPDDELFTLAGRGELHQPSVLQQQLQRMLQDTKVSRFTESFPRQWLQLHRVGQFPPDSELYPDYDKWLERSMVLESTQFFREVFADNLSIREFLHSRWTVMNARLAMHYGKSFPPQAGFQRVELTDADHRGGVLTHASVLSLTSDGARHRPVHRGVWVSEAIFGRTPPPPPPNVEPLEPTPSNKPKATIREQLQAHATHATCASCHRNIDPLGFAFDNYDAIGRWRTTEKVAGGLGDDPQVNASGQFPDGRQYSGPDQFKQRLSEDMDRFAVAFIDQLATYALRRVMTIDDQREIEAIAVASKQDGYALRTVIEQLVKSDLFQKR